MGDSRKEKQNKQRDIEGRVTNLGQALFKHVTDIVRDTPTLPMTLARNTI
jgi:hypothetical protein